MSLQAGRQAGKVDNTLFISAALHPELQVPEFKQVFRHGQLTCLQPQISPAVPALVLGGANCCTNCFGASLHPLIAAEVFQEAPSAIYMFCACLHFQSLSIRKTIGIDRYVLGRRPCDFATTRLLLLAMDDGTMDDPFDLCLVAPGRISVQSNLPVAEVLLRNRGTIDFVSPQGQAHTSQREKDSFISVNIRPSLAIAKGHVLWISSTCLCRKLAKRLVIPSVILWLTPRINLHCAWEEPTRRSSSKAAWTCKSSCCWLEGTWKMGCK